MAHHTGPTIEHQSVLEVVSNCQTHFVRCLQRLSKDSIPGTMYKLVEDELKRFKSWTTNLGVYAMGRASLDYRLRDADDIKQTTILLLESLSRHLGLVYDSRSIHEPTPDISSPSTTTSGADDSATHKHFAEAIQNIRTDIDFLFTLLNAIRLGSLENRDKRAVTNFVMEDADSFRDNFAATLIAHKFPDTSPEITSRLALAMLLRRKRYLHRRSRQAKYSKEKPPEITTVSVNDRASPPKSPQESTYHPLPSSGAQVPQSSLSVSNAPSKGFTATTLDVHAYKKSSAHSVVSSSTASAVDDNATDYPPIPDVPQDNVVICPYCFVVLTTESKNRRKWIAHVKQDLDAYVCLFEPCDKAESLFKDSRSWITHMRTEHLTQYKCPSKAHLGHSKIFSTAKELETHLRQDHPKICFESTLPRLVARSTYVPHQVFDSCPLCGDASAERMNEHVGEHLRFLALRSLPWPESSDGENSTASAASSKPNINTTVAAELEEACDLHFDDASNQEEPMEDALQRDGTDVTSELTEPVISAPVSDWDAMSLPEYTTKSTVDPILEHFRHYRRPPTEDEKMQLFQKTETWIKECANDHEICSKSIVVNKSPSRLLCIDEPGNRIKTYSDILFQNDDNPSQIRYAVYTSIAGLENRTDGSGKNQVSANTQDTSLSSHQQPIELCQKLGLRYIWIEDKCLDGSYGPDRVNAYSGAVFVIVAADATMTNIFDSRGSAYNAISRKVQESIPGPTAHSWDVLLYSRRIMLCTNSGIALICAKESYILACGSKLSSPTPNKTVDDLRNAISLGRGIVATWSRFFNMLSSANAPRYRETYDIVTKLSKLVASRTTHQYHGDMWDVQIANQLLWFITNSALEPRPGPFSRNKPISFLWSSTFAPCEFLNIPPWARFTAKEITYHEETPKLFMDGKKIGNMAPSPDTEPKDLSLEIYSSTLPELTFYEYFKDTEDLTKGIANPLVHFEDSTLSDGAVGASILDCIPTESGHIVVPSISNESRFRFLALIEMQRSDSVVSTINILDSFGSFGNIMRVELQKSDKTTASTSDTSTFSYEQTLAEDGSLYVGLLVCKAENGTKFQRAGLAVCWCPPNVLTMDTIQLV